MLSKSWCSYTYTCISLYTVFLMILVLVIALKCATIIHIVVFNSVFC